MCCGCWQKYGSPKIDNDRVRAAAKSIAAVYDLSATAGNLHIYLDNWNLELMEPAPDNPGALAQIVENFQESDAEELEVQRRCAEALLALSMDERASAMGLEDGCWGREAPEPEPVLSLAERTLPSGLIIVERQS